MTGRLRLHHTGSMVETADEAGRGGGCAAADRDPPAPTLLTVPTLFSRVARIRMTLLPARPSTKGNVKAHGPQEGLSPAEAAGERARIVRPAGVCSWNAVIG
jgi:hypothetical protein